MPISSKGFLDVKATIYCGFTLTCLRDMMITCSQTHSTEKNSKQSSIIWPFLLNGWVLIYKIRYCAFESCYSQLNVIFHVCFTEEVPWHSGSYRVWICSKICTWHVKKIQWNAPYLLLLTTQLSHLAIFGKRLNVHLPIKWLFGRLLLQALKV